MWDTIFQASESAWLAFTSGHREEWEAVGNRLFVAVIAKTPFIRF